LPRTRARFLWSCDHSSWNDRIPFIGEREPRIRLPVFILMPPIFFTAYCMDRWCLRLDNPNSMQYNVMYSMRLLQDDKRIAAMPDTMPVVSLENLEPQSTTRQNIKATFGRIHIIHCLGAHSYWWIKVLKVDENGTQASHCS
jgi:hypothetical protein